MYVSDIIDKVKSGLATIHKARMRIEQTMANDPDSVSAEKRTKLILSVGRNVEDISNMLALAEKKQDPNGTATAANRNAISMLSKLRRDCEKEKEAIEQAFSRNQDQGGGARRPTPGCDEADDGPQPQPHQFTMLNKGSKSHSLNFARPPMGVPPVATKEDAPVSVFSTPGTPRVAVGFGARAAPVPKVGGGGSFSAGASKQTVHSGKGAGTFSLDKIVSQSDTDSALDGQDGHYMSEALQRKLIEKKLVGKDEATVMQEIIDERSDAIEDVRSLVLLCCPRQFSIV